MSQVAATIAAANPTTNTGAAIGIRPLRDHLVGTSTRLWMLMLLAAVGIVLLIACANVANLWLARASVQQRDAAVRAALGASRGRLVQRVLIESLVVSVAGTIVGLALAWLCVRVLAAALPENVARVAAIGIDARVLAVAAIAALVTGLVSGLAPALQGSSPALSTVLNESARGGGTSRGRRRARAVLVVAEVALAVVLLVGAALFIGSFINVMRIDPGFRTEGVLAAQLIQRPSPGAAPARHPAGPGRHRRPRAPVAWRDRRGRGGARHSVPHQPADRRAAGAWPTARLQHDGEREGRHRRLPPDAGDPPQERPVLHGRRS